MVKDRCPLHPADADRPIDLVLDRVRQAHPEARADRSDGLRLDWTDAWVHVRASNTEPIVRVIAESADENQARDLVDRVKQAVTSASG
jgi:phosphomannomutase